MIRLFCRKLVPTEISIYENYLHRHRCSSLRGLRPVRDEDREESCNDGDGDNFHIYLFLLELIFGKTVGSSQKRRSRVQQEVLDFKNTQRDERVRTNQ